MSSSLNGFNSFANGAAPPAAAPKLPAVFLMLCIPHDADGGGEWKVSDGDTDMLSLLETSLRIGVPLEFCIFMFSVKVEAGISG
jgi:hypothetical protein